MPATVRSDHPGEEQREVAEPFPYPLHRRRKAAGGDGEDALVVLHPIFEATAASEPVAAPVRRPPVDRDETLSPAHLSSAAPATRGSRFGPAVVAGLSHGSASVGKGQRRSYESGVFDEVAPLSR